MLFHMLNFFFLETLLSVPLWSLKHRSLLPTNTHFTLQLFLANSSPQSTTSNLPKSAKHYTQAEHLIKQKNLTSFHNNKILSLLTQSTFWNSSSILEIFSLLSAKRCYVLRPELFRSLTSLSAALKRMKKCSIRSNLQRRMTTLLSVVHTKGRASLSWRRRNTPIKC